MVAVLRKSRRRGWVRKAILSIVILGSMGAGWSDTFDPLTRAKMVLALLGVSILGIGMIVMLVLGGRFVRRRMQVKPAQPSRIFPSDWPDRPKRKPPEASNPSD